MTDLNKLPVAIGCLDDGSWFAATVSAPYFCFEADSEDAVLGIAARAIRFYKAVLDANGGELPSHHSSRRDLHVKRTVTAGDLIAA